MVNQTKTKCCVVGGGPAGIFLGYLLARSGVDVVVLEKHADFLRDFRGDTIHPSTLELLYELDLLDEFLPLVDFRAEELEVNFQGKNYKGPTFSHLKTHCKFICFVPQWDFLNFLSSKAKQFDEFELVLNARATDVIRDGDTVVGVKYLKDEVEHTVMADLLVAADGRSSTIRNHSNIDVISCGVPVDALWFRLDRPQIEKPHTLGWLKDGHMLITIPRKSHYQVANLIKKGSLDYLRSKGISEFRKTVGNVCPPLTHAASRLSDWQEVKLLSIQINRMTKWYQRGLLFIGDAAHAMSPIGGVGINLAIQDAVAAANVLAEPLAAGTVNQSHLEKIQLRRQPAATRIQRIQARAHAVLFGGDSNPETPILVPRYLRLLLWVFAPVLRRIAGYLIGIGFQQEHIQCKPKNKESKQQHPS